MTDEIRNKLIASALEARERSYCPYSGFAVGAALLTASGKLFTGANIENASYTPTVCAERVAFGTAIHAGERDFSAIAIVGAGSGVAPSSPIPPCGVCRQFMTEFCGEDFEIILFDGNTAVRYTLGELMPASFTKKDLGDI